MPFRTFEAFPIGRERIMHPFMTDPFAGAPTRVMGHRGSPRRALENTFDSFDRAEADGADGFELDVRLTADGEPVVFHDADVRLATRTVSLGSLSIAELAGLVVEKDGLSGRIPTLRDVLMRYGANVLWLVELKQGPTPKSGLLEFRTAALLTQLALLSRSTVLSFSAELLRRTKEHAPDANVCLNFDATSFRPVSRLWPDLPRGCGAIGPHVALASEELVREAKAKGLLVHVWTVNDPEQAARLAGWGVASVITDVPEIVGPAVRAVTGARAPLAVA